MLRAAVLHSIHNLLLCKICYTLVISCPLIGKIKFTTTIALMPLKEILFSALYFLLFNFVVVKNKRFQLSAFKPWVSVALLNAKFLAGLCLWLIYTFYYTDTVNNDVHKFYKDALVLHQVKAESPKAFYTLLFSPMTDSTANIYATRMQNWERNFDEAPVNENRTIIRLNTLLLFVSAKTYFVHVLIMCFLSFIGWLLVANALTPYLTDKNSGYILPVLFFPSVLLWASGVMKEPILILGLGLFVYGFLANAGFILRVTAVFAGALILLSVKFYVLACMLPAGIAYMASAKLRTNSAVLSAYLVSHLLIALLAFNLQTISNVNAMQMLVNKQQHAIKEAGYFKAGSTIEAPVITATAPSIIMAAPKALFNALMQPSLLSARKPVVLFNAVENLLVLAFLIYLLAYCNWKNPKHLNTVLFLLSASLIYFVIIGICTPVAGNLVRYKAPLLPIFLFAFLVFADIKRPLLPKILS